MAGTERTYTLSLTEMRFAPDAPAIPFRVENAMLYIAEGTVGHEPMVASENQALFYDGEVHLQSDHRGARALCFSLSAGAPTEAARRVAKLAQAIALDPRAEYLMRCDRVDFPPGGVAYLHTHQGPGIRCLLKGRLTVETEGRVQEIEPGGAWFESGPEPVLATASTAQETAFVRVMVLPRALLGKSSIRYVRAEDRDKPKPQRYTVFQDVAIDIQGGGEA